MIAQEYEFLLQAELDGENTPEESARLHAWLESSPEGRSRLRELEGLFHAIAQVERAEVPGDLRRSILDTIAAGQADEAAPAGWREAFAAAFARHPALRHAYPFAAGLVLGVLAFALLGRVLPGTGREPLPVSGTMLPLTRGPAGTVAERHVLLAGAQQFTLETSRAGDVVELRLGGGPAQAVQVAVGFDPERLALQGVDWTPPVRARLETGPGRLLLRFEEYAPAVARFRATGAQDAEVRVTLRAAGRSGQVALRTGEMTTTGVRP